jgi:hypothetical protein
MRFKKGDKIELESGETALVKQELGDGAQGVVYLVAAAVFFNCSLHSMLMADFSILMKDPGLTSICMVLSSLSLFTMP